MKRIIVETEDGSKTIHIEDLNETYHSIHGAVQEAFHVFINNGLYFFYNIKKPIKILEIGLGTGLNSFISLLESEKKQLKINYVGVEKYPISAQEFENINYFDDVFKFYPEFENRRSEFYEYYQKMFTSEWENEEEISPYFTLKKLEKDFFELRDYTVNEFDLVYFDAFGSQVQPDLWEEELLTIVANLTKDSSVITTYAAKGTFKRGMKANGFRIEKRPGPPGKREMMVAFKNFSYE
ncbi:tRNA (5-methylaminomethyl-2-thiouridine)(34)-methyltransferase MnmD [Faecalibacter bovis]|uniref:tRNA (5-methylaminomethyl-2-thiouridine)(34)-methyltransferase MnmD n=1 Tax=Faecalibacter bovis TaxID=2898187 RepID=A0ABX7XA19_9FLAO|nr:tRNA (5-methylaminomethyl-2-thiouridine)(34)-methyltransferase MnmD [Faecalibacter bovis]QTV04733.1 tRNA (5-methylaminomethyl-2-thiouridine)(34)-methyltransferase MnmD [Faecalibacter bovis]